MKITAAALALTVDDPTASAAFVTQHFGFHQDLAADGVVSLSRADAGFNLIFLRTGLATFKPRSRLQRTWHDGASLPSERRSACSSARLPTG